MTSTRVGHRGVTEPLRTLLDQTVDLGAALIEGVRETVKASSSELQGRLDQVKNGSCQIPPPCWEPRHAGDVYSAVCPGGTATVRIEITNCSWTQRNYTVVTTSHQGDPIEQDPKGAITLGPQQKGTVALKMRVDEDGGEALIQVFGCLIHYVRWTVDVSHRGCDSVHEVQIEDCQEHIHHWYDHFYCRRPCHSYEISIDGDDININFDA